MAVYGGDYCAGGEKGCRSRSCLRCGILNGIGRLNLNVAGLVAGLQHLQAVERHGVIHIGQRAIATVGLGGERYEAVVIGVGGAERGKIVDLMIANQDLEGLRRRQSSTVQPDVEETGHEVAILSNQQQHLPSGLVDQLLWPDDDLFEITQPDANIVDGNQRRLNQTINNAQHRLNGPQDSVLNLRPGWQR